MTNAPPEWYTPANLAAITGLPYRAVVDRMKTGHPEYIPHRTFTGRDGRPRYHIPADEALKFIAAHPIEEP